MSDEIECDVEAAREGLREELLEYLTPIDTGTPSEWDKVEN